MHIEPSPLLHARPPQFAAGASPAVFHQLGTLTRQLHDTLTQLGVMPRLQNAAEGLPDARSRLHYIATKTGEAADRVLTSVDRAKAEQAGIAAATREVALALAFDPVGAVAGGTVMNYVRRVEAATGRIDGHLTDIMLSQDFHDLTGQVVAKVVSLAADLEDSLVRLVLQTAPPEQVHKAGSLALAGPVVDAALAGEVVTNQGEVDDLLASLGF